MAESHNTLERLTSQVLQLRLAESLLLSGVTANDAAVELDCSVKQARRLFLVLESLGAIVSNNFKVGDTKPATYKMQKSTRVFVNRSIGKIK